MRGFFFVLVLMSVGYSTAQATPNALIHDKSENCQVLHDARCLKNILHTLANMSQSGSSSLLPGIYKKTGSSTFCPQSIKPVYESGRLDKVKLTYISPCSGAMDELSCTGSYCQTSDGKRSVSIINASSYYYTAENGEDTFARQN